MSVSCSCQGHSAKKNHDHVCRVDGAAAAPRPGARRRAVAARQVVVRVLHGAAVFAGARCPPGGFDPRRPRAAPLRPKRGAAQSENPTVQATRAQGSGSAAASGAERGGSAGRRRRRAAAAEVAVHGSKAAIERGHAQGSRRGRWPRGGAHPGYLRVRHARFPNARLGITASPACLVVLLLGAAQRPGLRQGHPVPDEFGPDPGRRRRHPNSSYPGRPRATSCGVDGQPRGRGDWEQPGA